MDREEARAAALAQLDQVGAESAEILNMIVGRVRADLKAGTDRGIVFAQLAVNVVNRFGVPRQGPAPYVFATAILKLAEDTCSNDLPTEPDE